MVKQLRYLINTLGIQLRHPKGRALGVKTISESNAYSRSALTKPKISPARWGRGQRLGGESPNKLDALGKYLKLSTITV